MPRSAFLIFAAAVLSVLEPFAADASLSQPYSWRKVSSDGQYVLVLVSYLSVKDDVDYFSSSNWPTAAKEAKEVSNIRAKYLHSGLYRNDGSTIPLWRMQYISDEQYELFFTADGQYVVFARDWSRANGSSLPVASFCSAGRFLAHYDAWELIPSFVAKAVVAGFPTRDGTLFDPKNLTYSVSTNSGEEFVFDVTTGKIIRHWSPWPFYLTGAIVILIAIPLALLAFGPSRRAWWGTIAILFCLCLLADIVAISLIDASGWYSFIALGALAASQMGLVVLWTGLGDNRAAARLFVALVFFLFWCYIGSLDRRDYGHILAIQIAVGTCLLQLARVGGFRWAQTHRQNDANWLSLRRWQFSLKGLLTWSVVIAVCLGLNRFIPERYRIDPRAWISAIPLIAITVLAAWTMLGSGRFWLRVVLLMIVAPLLLPAVYFIGQYLMFLPIHFTRPLPDSWEMFMLSLVGRLQALLLVGMLAIFRSRGYWLLQSPEVETGRVLQPA